MFNSNIPAASLLSIESSGLGGLGAHTPKTPEIVNSLIAMTNPLDNYSFDSAAAMAAISASAASSAASCSSAASTPVVTVRHFNGHPNGQLHSQDSSHSSCSGSPLDSPAGGTATTPSVQQTCSRLIKEGLKLSIQSKRKLSTCDSSSGSEQPHSKCSRLSSNHNGHSGGSSNHYSGNMSNANDDDLEESSDEDSETKSQPKGLTPEDEDRRRRRRERNKIAATKCRMKKRERTQNLIKESEVLDTQNVELKNQVRQLETERRKLTDMLESHGCLRSGGCQLPTHLTQSPAHKYLAELELDDAAAGSLGNNNNISSSSNGSGNNQQRVQSIPSMATFKFGSKTAAAMAQQLPTGYCKPSPSAQEFEHAGYQQHQQHQQQQQQQQQQQHNQQQSMNPASSNIDQQHQHQPNPSPGLLSDYVPNCDGLSSSNHNNPSSNTSVSSSNSSSNTSSNTSTTSSLTASSSAIEFVKNELVDSQSPYTTALSAERFLFEPSDGFPDIKHAVSVLPSPCGINGLNMASVVPTNVGTGGGNHNGSNGGGSNANGGVNGGGSNNNNNNHLMDFHQGLQHGNGIGIGIGNVGVGVGVGVGMTSCYDEDHQLMLMKSGCYESDLLSQLVDDGVAGEYVNLDTATAFMTNGGCLA
ncbi:activating transcription factor 3 [Drosophila serrata]|uniref:activating transcription factor 3 n=1 Tax=Drosophila serrata TaxID=7274 RepID=UPI000A1D28C0|nr:activating transcription factor 3 [Drosophila serrata]